eukprot:gene2823-3619_t
MADDVGARYMEDLNSLMGANMGKYSTLKRRQSKSHLARKDTSTRTEISGKSSLVSEHSVAHEEGSRPPPNGVAAQRRCSILWLRNDLRVHDHEVLCRANSESASMVPVFCFDPRDFGKTSSGFDKTGPYRAKFLIECVADLRKHLKQLGSDLVIRIGRPEEVLPQLVRETGAEAVMSHAEITVEEVQSEEDVRSALKEHDAELKLLWGSTLYHLDDLPFRLENMPSTYGAFRASVQDKVSVRTALKTPSELKGFPTGSNIEVGDIPTLQSLGLSSSSAQEQQEEPAAAITGCVNSLAMNQVEKNKATTETAVNWLVFELLWRDFFRFISKKYGTMHQQKEQQTRQPLPCA